MAKKSPDPKAAARPGPKRGQDARPAATASAAPARRSSPDPAAFVATPPHEWAATGLDPALLRPQIALFAEAAGADALGESRLGGRPDVAVGFAWPRLVNVGPPLSFIAQFDLAALRGLNEAASLPLPGSGRLAFYYDLAEKPKGSTPGERFGWRAMRDPMPVTRLRRHVFPEDLPAPGALTAQVLRAELAFGPPPAGHPAWAEAGVKDKAKIAAAIAAFPPPAGAIGALGGWAPESATCFEARAARYAEGEDQPKAWRRFRSLFWVKGQALGAAHAGLVLCFLIEEDLMAQRRFDSVIVAADS